MAKMSAAQFAANAQTYIGQPYSKIDCAKLIYLASNHAITAEGSNTQWRKECTGEKGKITDGKPTDKYPDLNNRKSSQLEIGMGVFCHKAQDTKKYPDGLGDYCHVGIVTSVNPLRICNASSEYGEVREYTRIGTFAAWAYFDDIDYGKETAEEEQEEQEEKEMGTMLYQAKVSGIDVAVRKQAKKVSGNIITRLKTGTVVDVYEESNGWSRIQQGSTEGWMMSKFLTKVEVAEAAETDEKSASEQEENEPETDETDTDEERLTTLEKAVSDLENRLTVIEDELEKLRGD